MSGVRVLKVIGMSLPRPMVLVNVPLIAKHLETLQLWSVLLDGCSMDFSRCERLEDLVSLQLYGNRGLTPSLESMPLLVTALVRLGPTTALKDLDGSQTCVLLESLSNATDLELVAESRVVHLFLPYLLVSVLANCKLMQHYWHCIFRKKCLL